MSGAAGQARTEPWRLYRPGLEPLSDLSSRVHVWCLRHDAVPGSDGSGLSDEDAARARSCPDATSLVRFVAGRRLLRMVLADILAAHDTVAPHRMTIAYGPAGKPRLTEDQNLHFNLCHAEAESFLAVSRSGPVGLAAERPLSLDEMRTLSRRHFSDAEQAALMGCLPGTCPIVFERLWTRKTALFKASGDASGSDGRGGAGWLLTALPGPSGTKLALARPRAAHGLKLWAWLAPSTSRFVERRTVPRARSIALPLSPAVSEVSP